MYEKWKTVTPDEVRAVIEPVLADKRSVPYAVPAGDGGPMPVDRIIVTLILKNGQDITVTIRPNDG